jgi:hypothetical protein
VRQSGKLEKPHQPRRPTGRPDTPPPSRDFKLWSPREGLPAFKLRLGPRRPGQTDAMYEASRRDAEQAVRIRSVFLATCQLLATERGNYQRCKMKRCRRLGECVDRRDEDTVALNMEMFPPCIPDDYAIVTRWWDAVQVRVKQLTAAYRAAHPEVAEEGEQIR